MPFNALIVKLIRKMIDSCLKVPGIEIIPFASRCSNINDSFGYWSIPICKVCFMISWRCHIFFHHFTKWNENYLIASFVYLFHYISDFELLINWQSRHNFVCLLAKPSHLKLACKLLLFPQCYTKEDTELPFAYKLFAAFNRLED